MFDYVTIPLYDGLGRLFQVKKRQQRVLMILDSKNIKYDVIDITEPGKESDKDFMQSNSTSNGGTVSDPNPRSALPPQIFNEDDYCGVSWQLHLIASLFVLSAHCFSAQMSYLLALLMLCCFRHVAKQCEHN